MVTSKSGTLTNHTKFLRKTSWSVMAFGQVLREWFRFKVAAGRISFTCLDRVKRSYILQPQSFNRIMIRVTLDQKSWSISPPRNPRWNTRNYTVSFSPIFLTKLAIVSTVASRTNATISFEAESCLTGHVACARAAQAGILKIDVWNIYIADHTSLGAIRK